MQAVHSYGPHYRTPLIQVRESLMVLRSLLHDGEVDLVSGTEAEVVTGLVAWIRDGMGEVLAHALLEPNDREGSLAPTFAAIARAAREEN